MEANWYDHIEQYNLGLMSDEQAAQFEAAMQADAELAAAVRAHRTEWEIQELLAENLLRAEIRKRLDAPPASGSVFKNWKYVLPVLLLLGVLAFFLFRKPAEAPRTSPSQPALPEKTVPENTPAPSAPAPSTPKTQQPVAAAPKKAGLRQLALATYRVPEGLSGIRGQSDDDQLNRATKAFSEKKYREALTLLETLPETDGTEALALRAHAQFNAGDFQAAARDFEALEAGGIYRREAQWFGLLARMALPGTDKAALKAELETIRQTAGHPYQKEAERLVREL